MKNFTVYIGTIKECLDIKNFKKDGDYTFRPFFEMSTSTTSMQFGEEKPNTKTINEQAILIKNQHGHFYNYEITNSFIDNLRIVLDDYRDIISSNPIFDYDLFYDEESLVPYYQEQPKKLSFRKLKKDLLNDPRIKSGIEKNK